MGVWLGSGGVMKAIKATGRALAFILCISPAAAEQVPTGIVKASVACGSHSSNPKILKSFQFDLQFDLFGSLWMTDRKITSPKTGEEKFRGILSPQGSMLIAAVGKFDDGESWTYEFSGLKNPKGITVLKGSFASQQPSGTRVCSLTF
jgi:hypothetical protein